MNTSDIDSYHLVRWNFDRFCKKFPNAPKRLVMAYCQRRENLTIRWMNGFEPLIDSVSKANSVLFKSALAQ